ncbi:MAG: D-glycero-beta-D-manno-heptose 1-phosphate adenylyltransferase [Nitrospiraceae bacterium]|nr:D-glycero-beta-D-manno-heptose 1-phosphate adenylyltransferase [Nitrospiraceae bacterium]
MGRVVSSQVLQEAVAALKAKGKRIVFTNGCFDIIHTGHVRYLREAKKLGDILIVGLNSDTSVAGIKPGRPVNPQDQRAEVLSALEMVDYVAIFDEDTPYNLIKLVRPDVLVKGGDWKKEDIIGSDIVPEVHSLPYIAGVSTTDIINKIKT